MSETTEDGRGPVGPGQTETVTIEADGASARFDPADGGRLASLRIGAVELLAEDPDPLGRGCYPMVPWAGRVDRGRFTFAGSAHQLPIGLGDHAIHGTGFVSPWTTTSQGPAAVTMSLDLAQPWPFGGCVEHRASIEPGRLHLELEVFAHHLDMPAMAGWHPWFLRQPNDGTTDTTIADAALTFGPASMYELDNMIPTGALVAPPPGPWDDCFTDLDAEPVIRWPGFVELSLSSDADHWVVYTQPDHALCVEPQTDAPDAFNRRPHVVRAGESLLTTFDLRWRSLSA